MPSTNWKRRLLYVASIVVLIATIVGCGSGKSSVRANHSAATSLPSILVEPSWLKEKLDSGNVLVIDARDPNEFALGHIPGAINITPKMLLDTDPNTPENLATVGVIQRVFSDSGIDMGHSVIVYDEGKDYRAAARVFWVLEVHGHPSVAVLNGGYGKWTQSSWPASTEPPQIVKRQFIPSIKPDRLATKLAVLRALNRKDVVILDSRSDDEYRGIKSEASRKGHIASAINVDAKRNLVFDADGTCSVQFSQGLLDLYRNYLDPSMKIISYCNSGNRASVSYLALRSLGYDVAVYDGSWLEWGNDSELPIE